MSLPPTGDKAYAPYLERGLTPKSELILHDVSTSLSMLLGFGNPRFRLSSECAELARTHKSIADPPGRVSSPSDSTSIVLGLHYTPLQGVHETKKHAEKAKEGGEGEEEASKGKEEKEEESQTAAQGSAKSRIQQEEIIFSGICHPQFAIIEPISSVSSLAGDSHVGEDYFVLASRLFDLLLRDLKQARTLESSNSFRQQKGPKYWDRDVHLCTDLTIFRIIMTLADFRGLKGFRIFPALSRPSQDRWRYDQEMRIRKAKAGLIPPLVDGMRCQWTVKPEEVPPYSLVVFCAGCGKKLVGEERKKCAGCGYAYFCGAECQKKDWELLHKDECRSFKRFFAAQKLASDY